MSENHHLLWAKCSLVPNISDSTNHHLTPQSQITTTYLINLKLNMKAKSNCMAKKVRYVPQCCLFSDLTKRTQFFYSNFERSHRPFLNPLLPNSPSIAVIFANWIGQEYEIKYDVLEISKKCCFKNYTGGKTFLLLLCQKHTMVGESGYRPRYLPHAKRALYHLS